MPPKTKFSKEDILTAAIEIVCEKGLKELTARAIALKLKSSTSPVYSHFENMEELQLEIMKGTQQKILNYTSKPYTESVFLNMGTGIILFACENRNLYKSLLLESDNYSEVIREFLDILELEMKKDIRFVNFSNIERRALLDKMWVYTHGMASLVCVGLVKDCSQEMIIKDLINIGSDVIGAAITKHNSQVK